MLSLFSKIPKSVSAGMNYKVINDCVHGLMAFHPLLMKIIDTPEFQRLRNIKQLGPTYYVYPGASHNRFEHSLGTCHLAGKLLDALERTDMRQDIRPTEQEKLCVLIAGLCHDIGHGPYSHTWELFLKKSGIIWAHEDASLQFIDRLLQSSEIKAAFDEYGFTDYHVSFIKHLIKVPKDLPAEYRKKYYLLQIISNNDYDVDVDKWDYLLRDQQQLNLKSSFDAMRMLNFCQVLTVRREKYDRLEICFRDKEITNLCDMLIARASLHQKAYQHHVVKIIEVMLVDAFIAANKECPMLKLTDTSTDNLIKMTDAIYYQILHSEHEGLQKAKRIVQRIESRNLYQYVVRELPNEFYSYEKEEEAAKLVDVTDKLHQLCKTQFSDVQREDFEIVPITIDMGPKYLENGPNCYIYKKDSQIAEKFQLFNPHIFGKVIHKVLQKNVLCLYKGPHEMTKSGILEKIVKAM